MRWKTATFEKIDTYNSFVEKVINTFKAQNLNGEALINYIKVHNKNFLKEIPLSEDRHA
ncbi:hypothetical protein [Bacillus mycoides]|uniref:hypothetical protein n=1 Tax=Bacillus mycoides TaxID=1405 RepID=UPI001C02931B|nr:hypothetical protein [Bacillus mycoides]